MDKLQELVLIAPILLFSMVAHEYAHGYVAYKNGDPTAYQLGRLTFNPLKHIDPFMTILLPVVLALSGAPILGGAKPVPVNPRNYTHFKRADIMVSLAGIVTNIGIAILCAAVVPLLYGVGVGIPATATGVAILQRMFLYGIYLNFLLAAFNLIPIPPLDGSHVFKYILPPGWALAYQRFGRYGLLVIYALLLLGGRLLLFWLLPADWMSTVLSNSVDRFVLPAPFGL